jgi:hypothetical protein
MIRIDGVFFDAIAIRDVVLPLPSLELTKNMTK